MTPEERLTLMRAGSRAVKFNSPLGSARAAELRAWIVGRQPRQVLELGCGRGAVLRDLRVALPHVELTGVDSDAEAIDSANSVQPGPGPSSEDTRPIRWICQSAADWRQAADLVICIGSSHALGGAAAMFERLAELCPDGSAVVGEAMFMVEPDEWCLESLGDQPRGIGGLEALAKAAGWSIEASSISTIEEWDEFEHGWIDGARSVGTPRAVAFADLRAEGYLRYRGVLGFAWLQLSHQRAERALD